MECPPYPKTDTYSAIRLKQIRKDDAIKDRIECEVIALQVAKLVGKKDKTVWLTGKQITMLDKYLPGTWKKADGNPVALISMLSIVRTMAEFAASLDGYDVTLKRPAKVNVTVSRRIKRKLDLYADA